MISLALTDEEWDRLVALRNITASGRELNAAELLACDDLSKRIKIPRPWTTPKPGVPPPTIPIVNQPPDSMVIA